MNQRKYAKTPTIYQMEATECGAASLTMILGYFGRFMPLEQMRIETGVSRDGCNAKNIMRAGKKFGLEVHGYRKGIEGLLELPVPCIIHGISIISLCGKVRRASIIISMIQPLGGGD